jgi:hypothetical protein
MRNAIRLSVICVAVMLGCAQPQPGPSSSHVFGEQLDDWPEDWSLYIGKKVTIVGFPEDMKNGSILSAEENSRKPWLWLDGQQWADKFCPEPLKGTHTRVTGTVIKRKDWTVSTPSGLEVVDRFWLKEASWEYLD